MSRRPVWLMCLLSLEAAVAAMEGRADTLPVAAAVEAC
jgi:hypothetical protein